MVHEDLETGVRSREGANAAEMLMVERNGTGWLTGTVG
jgi:hypothetical protein